MGWQYFSCGSPYPFLGKKKIKKLHHFFIYWPILETLLPNDLSYLALDPYLFSNLFWDKNDLSEGNSQK